MIVNFEDQGEGRKFANLVFNPIFEKQKSLSNEFYGSNMPVLEMNFVYGKMKYFQKIFTKF